MTAQQVVPLRHLVRRVSRRGYPNEELLSVYRDHGVVRKRDRDDNFNKASEDLSSYLLVQPGDLVLNKMKTWQGSLGVSDHRGIVSPAYFVCEPSDDVVPRFLHHLLRSRPLIAEYGARSQGIRPNQWDLPWDEFVSIKVRLPAGEDQRKIAEFLDGEYARIAELRSEVDAIRHVVALARDHELRRMIVEADYPIVPLKYYAQTGTGHTPSREHSDYWVRDDCVIPWFTLADVHQIRDGRREVVHDSAEHVSEVGLANSAAVKHPAGTVLLSRTASVGFSAVMGVDMAVSQDFMTWTCGPKLDAFYLLFALRAMRPDLKRLMYGSTHKTIYMPDLHALRVPLPPLPRQQQIVAAARAGAGSLWPLVDELGELERRLADYRDALIAEAVTGQLDVAAVETFEVGHRVQLPELQDREVLPT